MLKQNIPKHKFWTSDLPKLDPNFNGVVKPMLYGVKTNMVPVCKNTEDLIYGLGDRALKAIDKVVADSVELVEGTDYTVNLLSAEFSITGSPYLLANTTYYIAIESDFPIGGANYIGFAWSPWDRYADGTAWKINGAGVWTPDGVPDADLIFRVFGKYDLNGEESLIINEGENWENWNWLFKLRQTADRTRIGQSFKTPAGNGFYLTRFETWWVEYGSPPSSRITKFTIYSDIDPEDQVGGKSLRMEDQFEQRFGQWILRATPSNMRVDAQGVKNPDTSLMTNVADILKDIAVEECDATEDYFDSETFDDLKVKRTQELAIFHNTESPFEEIISTLEAGQLFKFLPTLDGKYAAAVFEAGEPDGTPHFKDERLLEFSCNRSWESVYQKVQVRYDQNPENQEWKVVEVTSDIADIFYKATRTLIVDTYLKNEADALQLANDYLGMVEYPRRSVSFDIFSEYGLGPLPTQKVKITRNRGDNDGGNFNGVLFRIFSIERDVGANITKMTAVLDIQTY